MEASKGTSGLSLRAIIERLSSLRKSVGTRSGGAPSETTSSRLKRFWGLVAAPRPRGPGGGSDIEAQSLIEPSSRGTTRGPQGAILPSTATNPLEVPTPNPYPLERPLNWDPWFPWTPRPAQVRPLQDSNVALHRSLLSGPPSGPRLPSGSSPLRPYAPKPLLPSHCSRTYFQTWLWFR